MWGVSSQGPTSSCSGAPAQLQFEMSYALPASNPPGLLPICNSKASLSGMKLNHLPACLVPLEDIAVTLFRKPSCYYEEKPFIMKAFTVTQSIFSLTKVLPFLSHSPPQPCRNTIEMNFHTVSLFMDESKILITQTGDRMPYVE